MPINPFVYPLESVIDAGITEVGLVVNETRPAIEALIGDGKKFGIHATYIDQPEPLVVGHVVAISEKFIGGDSFVYILGDNIFTEGIKKPLLEFQKSKAAAVLTVVEHNENFRLGVPFFDNKGKLIKVVEKPVNPPNKFAVPGLYLFSPYVFEGFKGPDAIKPSARGEIEIVDLYNYLLKKGKRVDVVEIDGKWRDPVKFDDALETNKLILESSNKTDIKGSVDRDSKIIDGVILGKGSNIINSQIVGPVTIGENVQITHSYIGPYTSIGDDSEIVNSKIEYCILLSDVNIIDVKYKIEAAMIGNHTVISTTKQHVPTYSFMIADHCRIELPF